MPGVTFMALTPITSPSRLISGPPELPNFKTKDTKFSCQLLMLTTYLHGFTVIDASVWMYSMSLFLGNPSSTLPL